MTVVPVQSRESEGRRPCATIDQSVYHEPEYVLWCLDLKELRTVNIWLNDVY